MLEHQRHHASTVDLLVHGEFGWDPATWLYFLQDPGGWDLESQLATNGGTWCPVPRNMKPEQERPSLVKRRTRDLRLRIQLAGVD